MLLYKGLLLLLCTAVAVASFKRRYAPVNPSLNQERVNEERLPMTLSPDLYKLFIYPNIEGSVYNGSVYIYFNCDEETDKIQLHAHETLKIVTDDIVLVNLEDNKQHPIINVSRNNTEILNIYLQNNLKYGTRYKLYILFSAEISQLSTYYYPLNNDAEGGIFKGNYINQHTFNKGQFISLHSSLKHARKVFPCFDEPNYKARFQVSIARPMNMSTIFFTPIEYTESIDDSDNVVDHFQQTPPVSTFSIGFIIHAFEKHEEVLIHTTKGDFTVDYYHRDYSDLNYQEDNFTSLIGVLEYLTNFTDIKYPLTNLKLVGMPNMYTENRLQFFGLIMAPEYLINSRYSQMGDSLTSQWLNHIITPLHYNDSIFTDFFGSFLTKSAMKKLDKKWNSYEINPQNLYNSLCVRLNYSIDGVTAYYGTQRGELFLQMLNNTMSERAIQKSLHYLIANNKFGTYTSDIFWDELSQQAYRAGTLSESVTLKDISTQWLNNKQIGYPVLTVTRDYMKNSAFLEQHMFINELPSALTEEEQSVVWSLPLSYMTTEYINMPIEWMLTKTYELRNLPDSDSFVIFNANDSGIFLVNYDLHNWNMIAANIEHFPKQIRSKLVNDVMMLAQTEELDYVTAFNMTTFLRNESELSVLSSFTSRLSMLGILCRNTPIEDKLYTYLRDLLSPTIKSMNVNEEPIYQGNPEYYSFWYNVKDALRIFGDQKSLDDEVKVFFDPTPLYVINDSAIGLNIYCPEFLRNDTLDWDTHSKKLLQNLNTLYTSRRAYERGLMYCPGYTELIERSVNQFLDEDVVFSTTGLSDLINLITSSEQAVNISFNYFLQHYKELKQKFYFMQDMWTLFVTSMMKSITTEVQLNKFNNLYEEHKTRLGYTKSIMEETLKEVNKTVNWIKVKVPEIERWLVIAQE